MIVSVNWLKKFTRLEGSIDELATRIGARLVEIEGVESLGEKYKDVIVARVVEAGPLEGSDHLNLTKIDDGGVREGVERDERGLIQVVCGAPNVRAGLLVAWLPPQSVVPETFGDDDPFTLSAKPLRGAMSNGMIASARELDLYDEHDGILEIDKEAAPGDSFAELYELDDYLLDIENKSLTHRPDAFGLIGFAREVAGIQGQPFVTPEWLDILSGELTPEEAVLAPKVSIEDASLSDRFQMVAFSAIDESKTSPIQLQSYLARSGVRPINALVDVSNYLMLLTGQPTHMYDYDKVKAIAGDDFTVGVRAAVAGETLTLLDGKTIELDTSDIVIVAGATPIGLAGIMGGQSTMVDASTKTTLLEVATFNLYSMRSSQMRHGIFSEAVTRYTKGIPAALGTPVIFEAARMLHEYTGAQVASGIIDDYPGERPAPTVQVSEQKINETLGTRLSAEDISLLLQNVGFEVTFNGLEATVEVPYWRQDIHIAEDIIEEVGRLYGFDLIESRLPMREITALRPSSFDTFRATLRRHLVRAGANEVLTYSFIHGDTMKKAGQDPSNAYRITNSISPDLQYYRQSITPSLLLHVQPNSKAGFDTFGLFELNKVHRKADGLNDESVPVERDSLAYVTTGTAKDEVAYYSAKQVLEYMVRSLGVTLSYAPLEGELDVATIPFEPKRAALILNQANGVVLGVVGEYKKSVQKAFKLSAGTAGFEVDIRALSAAASETGISYQPLSRYPATERDVCFQVSQSVAYASVLAPVEAVLAESGLITDVQPLDIYQPENGDIKNITLRIRLTSYDKTMTGDEVAEVMNRVIERTIRATNGKVI